MINSTTHSQSYQTGQLAYVATPPLSFHVFNHNRQAMGKWGRLDH